MANRTKVSEAFKTDPFAPQLVGIPIAGGLQFGA